MLSAGVRSALWKGLPVEDYMCIHRGHDEIQRFLLHFVEKLTTLCLMVPCMQGIIEFRVQVLSESIKRRDVLGTLQSFQDGRFLVAHGVCSQCTMHTLKGIARMRQIIFQSLGRFFSSVTC
jgi:hypothetical protein